MASILDLPSELLEDILLPLLTASLSRLSRTCKTLHTFLSPRIYHTIDWTWRDEDTHAPPFLLLLQTLLANPDIGSKVKVLKLRGRGIMAEAEWKNQKDTNSQLQPLCMTQNIGESAHIQAIIVTWQEALAEKQTQLDKLIAKKDQLTAKLATKLQDSQNYYLTKVAAAVYGIEIPGHPFSSWMQEFKRGNIDVFVALLLRQLPALENLDLGYGYLHRATFLPTMLHHLAFDHPTLFFSNLASVTMATDAPYSPIGFWAHLDLTRPLFYLPNVHTIDAMVTEPVIFAWPSPTLIPNLTSLSRLVLRKSTLMPKTLGGLLACTPQLQHLYYEHVRSVGWGSPQWEDYEVYCPLPPYVWKGEPPNAVIEERRPECADCFNAERPLKQEFFFCAHLNAALAHVKNTLETLILKIRFHAEHYERIFELEPGHSVTLCGVIGHLTTLPSFTRLAKLEIPWCVLFGWEADLPEKFRNRVSRPDELLTVFPEFGSEEDWDFSRFDWTSVLPRTITKLVLRDDLKDFEHYGYTRRATAVLVRRLLFHSQKETNFPELKQLGFYFEVGSDGCRRSSEEQDVYDARVLEAFMQRTALLREACEEKGVGCEIVREQRVGGGGRMWDANYRLEDVIV